MGVEDNMNTAIKSVAIVVAGIVVYRIFTKNRLPKAMRDIEKRSPLGY